MDDKIPRLASGAVHLLVCIVTVVHYCYELIFSQCQSNLFTVHPALRGVCKDGSHTTVRDSFMRVLINKSNRKQFASDFRKLLRQ